MVNTSIADLNANLASILEQVVKYNEQISVATSAGDAVIISGDDYRSLMETVYLTSIPGMKEKLIEGLNTPPEECIPEDKVAW